VLCLADAEIRNGVAADNRSNPLPQALLGSNYRSDNCDSRSCQRRWTRQRAIGRAGRREMGSPQTCRPPRRAVFAPTSLRGTALSTPSSDVPYLLIVLNGSTVLDACQKAPRKLVHNQPDGHLRSVVGHTIGSGIGSGIDLPVRR
jgi:hypothetical protein